MRQNCFLVCTREKNAYSGMDKKPLFYLRGKVVGGILRQGGSLISLVKDEGKFYYQTRKVEQKGWWY